MWRKLLESTAAKDTKYVPKVAILNAPSSLVVGNSSPEFPSVAYTFEDIDLYWLQESLIETVTADLTVYCIDWHSENWNLEYFITLKGQKVLHVFNYDESFNSDAEFIQQYLRLVCIEAKAALAFQVDNWKDFLLGELNLAPKVTPDVVTKILIPSDWDTPAKITATREDFPVSKNWREIKLPKSNEHIIPTAEQEEETIQMSEILAAVKGDNGVKEPHQDPGKIFEYLMERST